MANLLYLVHRLPYPPNKGDKVRSYHLLKHLAARHRVFLATFVDDPDDEIYVGRVRDLCADLFVARLNPRLAKIRSLVGLLTNQSLSLQYYKDARMQSWVKQTLATKKIDAAVVFSSTMAQYVGEDPGVSSPPMFVDFVDVDSAKWAQYSGDHQWPMSWLYRREGERLLAYERGVAARSQRSFFVTDKETALFQTLAPECAGVTETMSNGVDSNYFSPAPECTSPFAAGPPTQGQIPVVFTGAMDYWPNIDAVTWFVNDVLPKLRQNWPTLRFYIVGRSPSPAVMALACEAVVVTGTVPDVRPYLQHAALIVAPLRVARGIQNKILEAMSMARPVVASRSCVEAIDARDGQELISATDANDFASKIDTIIRGPERAAEMGLEGRRRVINSYSWTAHLSRIDGLLSPNQIS